MRPYWALLVLAAGVAAQPPANEFAIFPGVADAASRAGLPDASAGDVLVAIRNSSFRYVGNTANVGAPITNIVGFHAVVQNGSTPATVTFVIRPENTTSPGQPDPTKVLLRMPPVTVPSSLSATDLSATFATPLNLIGLPTATWFFGIGLPASADVSVQMASYYGLGGFFPATHDNPSLSATDLTWFVDTTNATVGQTATPRTMQLGVLTNAPVLNPGQDVVVTARTGPNPMFGVGGVWPDNLGQRTQPTYAARNGFGDGVALRVRDAANSGGVAVMLASGSFAVPGSELVVPGFGGVVPLSLSPVVVLGTAPLTPTGSGGAEAILSLAAPGTLSNVHGTVVWSAVTLDANMANPRLTNAAATHLN